MKHDSPFRIHTPNGVDEKIYIPIQGQTQYTFLRGEDQDNPVILYLHGGPANPDAYLIYEFARELCRDYTLVCWDQRGCGRTYFKNCQSDPNNRTASFRQALLDVDELVDYLRRRFGKDKIILMGHSYGTLLGIHYIQGHPEKVSAYIGIGQTISLRAAQEENYRQILHTMKQENLDTSPLTAAYQALEKDLTIEHLTAFQQLTLRHFSAHKPASINQKSGRQLILHSPDVSWADIRWLLGMLNRKAHFARNAQLMDTILHSDLFQEELAFSVPMYFLSGDYDKHCPTTLLRRYFDTITAPVKEMVILPGCGHSPHADQPRQLADQIRKLLAQ